MTTKTSTHRYRSTESKYKGGATEMYVTYDIEQKTRAGGTATYPKVKRVYIAGDVKNSRVGTFEKRTGREVHGVRIEYAQSRSGYRRRASTAERGESHYDVAPAWVGKPSQNFVQIVEVPESAENVHFYPDAASVPERYQHALQRVR
jgi:hypothetical protein